MEEPVKTPSDGYVGSPVVMEGRDSVTVVKGSRPIGKRGIVAQQLADGISSASREMGLGPGLLQANWFLWDRGVSQE